jgi:hypothetical protein
MKGDWKAAAAAWERIGCPYERALALAGGDEPAQLQALDILTGLGATPAAASGAAPFARRRRARHSAWDRALKQRKTRSASPTGRSRFWACWPET